MNPSITSGLLQLISAAVTPVVMISACAALILGVNNKHSGIADRIRDAAAEYRKSETPLERKRQLQQQIFVFYRRYRFTWISLFMLYGAIIAFILTAMLIIFTQKRFLSVENGTLTFFVIGVALMLIASCAEVAEVALSTHNLKIEMRDVTIALKEKAD